MSPRAWPTSPGALQPNRLRADPGALRLRRRGRGLAVAFGTVLVVGAVHPERAAAQWIQFTQADPASVGPNWAAVSVRYGGSHGVIKTCDSYGYGCVYQSYDNTAAPNALQFIVNGVRQDRVLRITAPAENCWYGSDGTYNCDRIYTATNSKLTLPPNATSTLSVQLGYLNYNGTQTAQIGIGPVNRAHPLVSVGAQEELNRDVGRCVAACFDAVATISTPAYTSLDVARGVALVYRSNRGRGALTLDVTDPSATAAASISLRLFTSDGRQVTFDNGATALWFTRGQRDVRLVGTFGGYGLAYGAFPYEMTATIASVWPDGDYRVVDVPVRMPVEGQWSSPYGAGWTVAGVRTIRGNADGGRPTMTVLDGTGTVQVFDGNCAQLTANCVYSPPPGVASGAIMYQPDGYGATYQQTFPDGSVVGYNASGNEVYAADGFGARTTFYWRDDARLDSIVDPARKATTFQWDGSGHLSGIVDPMGRRTAVQVDGNGDLVNVWDPLNQQATYAYQNHLLTHYTQAGGGTWDYLYDAAGKLVTTMAPAIQTNAGGQRPVTRTQSSIGQRLAGTQSGQGSAGNPLPGTTSIAVGDLVTDAANNTVTYLLDRYGEPSYARMPDGSVSTIAGNELGFPTRVVTANGHDTRTYYNPYKPWLVDSTWDVTTNQHARYAYLGVGVPAFIPYSRSRGFYEALASITGDVTPITNTWSNGRLASTQTGVGGPTTRYVYLHAGDARPDSVVDQNGHGTAYTYAPDGFQNTASVSTTGGTTGYGYDGYGRLQTVTNPRGDTTHTDYDALNRVVATVDGLGHVTRQEYNALYPTAVVDAKGARYQNQAVNALGGVQVAADPSGRTTGYTRDILNRVVQTTDRRGQIVQFAYGPTGNVTWMYTGESPSPTFWQDPSGHVAVAANREAIDSTFYDDAGRVVQTVHVIPALLQAGRPAVFNVRSAYDVQGRRTQVQMGWVNHWALTLAQYGYNALGQLETLTDPTGLVTRFGYTKEGTLLSRTLPGSIGDIGAMPTALHVDGGQQFTGNSGLDNRFGTQLALDGLGRITERVRTGSQQGSGHQFDRAGQLAGVSNVTYTGGNPQTDCTPIYGRPGVVPDESNEQPTSYYCPPGSGPTRSETPVAFFSYDAVGNPTDAGANYASDADRLNNRLYTFNGQKYFYDAAGNRWAHLDVDGTFRDRPAWNALGQLAGIAVSNTTLPAGAVNDSVDFGYDALGRRVRKTVVNAGRTTYYLWDGDQVAAELDGYGTVTAAYAYYPGVDRPQSVRVAPYSSSDRTYYYVQGDAPGNVLGLVDANADIAATYEVDVWGQPTKIDEGGLGGWRQPYLFAGREYDRETGYYYNRARYYDPVARRFLSEDPSGLAGGINLYAYAGNDPVDQTDPPGTGPCPYDQLPTILTDGAGNITGVSCASGGSGTPTAQPLPGVTVTGTPSSPPPSLPFYPSACLTCGSAPSFPAGPGVGEGVGAASQPSAAQPQPKNNSCPNVSSFERQVADRDDRRSAGTGVEEGTAIVWGFMAVPVIATRTPSSISPLLPWGTTTFIHNHPSGRGISENDSVFAYANNVRVVSGSARTRVYGSINPGGSRVTCQF